MISPVENGLKISHDEPGNMKRGNFRKFMPEKTLFSKKKLVIDNGNSEITIGVRRDDNIESMFGHDDWGYQPDIFVPKHDDTLRESVRKHYNPVLVLGGFSVETINTIGIGSGFDETNHHRFVGMNKMKNVSKSFSC